MQLYFVENAEDNEDMTMSDSEVQASTTGEDSLRTATENGISDVQEVNKAKDPADGGGSLLHKADNKCVGDKNHAQASGQSPNKSKLRRGISFPKESFVSGYCDPPNPWKEGSVSKFIMSIIISDCPP